MGAQLVTDRTARSASAPGRCARMHGIAHRRRSSLTSSRATSFRQWSSRENARQNARATGDRAVSRTARRPTTGGSCGGARAASGPRSPRCTIATRRVVHGVLLARVARDEVEDLVQDVFLAAWRRLDDLRDPAAFGGWLTMIARNRATDFHRRSPEFVELPEKLPVREAVSAEADARAALDGDPWSSRRLSRDTGAAARRRAHRSRRSRAHRPDARPPCA